MHDREKVKTGIFEMLQRNTWKDIDKERHRFQPVLNDALALLKEQEAKWIHREDLDFKDKWGCNHFHGMCGNCGFIHDFIDNHTGQYRYCPQCGRSVKWE